MSSLSLLVIFGSFLLMLLSNGFIVKKIPSTEEKQKAFPKCFSHLVVVAVHFERVSMIYLRPKSRPILDEDTFLSVTYTVMPPLLNSVAYNLNKQEHAAGP